MQYAFLQITDKYKCLVDANELLTLNSNLGEFKENPLDDSSFIFKIFYGAYFPQRDKKLSYQSALEHIDNAKDKWLIHLSKHDGIYMGIKDLVILSDNSNKIPFASLVSVPPSFELNKKGQAKTAFLRWHNLDIITNLINRDGLFSFVREERRNMNDIILTPDNWKTKIDEKRAIKNAASIV